MNTEKLEEMKKDLELIASSKYIHDIGHQYSITCAKAILLCMEAMEGERGV
jgi:hypothetical protein